MVEEDRADHINQRLLLRPRTLCADIIHQAFRFYVGEKIDMKYGSAYYFKRSSPRTSRRSRLQSYGALRLSAVNLGVIGGNADEVRTQDAMHARG